MRGAALARENLGERPLTVSVHAGDAEDLALAQLERDVLDAELGALAGTPTRRAARARRRRSTRAGFSGSTSVSSSRSSATSANGLRLLAEHDPDDLARAAPRGPARAARRGRSFPPAAPGAGSRVVAERQRLVELVGDEDHRLALLLQAREDLRELCDALRGEHRRRLVEDQHTGAAPERLDDLDLLLVAEGEVGRASVRVDLDAEHRGQLCQTGTRSRLVEPHAARVAEHQVLEHGQRRDQRGVLVDGADPELERHARRDDLGLAPLDQDAPGVGPLEPGEDPDQRRLARAVLAQQAVDFAALEREVDVVVREHAWERLRDPPELDDGRVGHEVSLGDWIHPVTKSLVRAARGGGGDHCGRRQVERSAT